MANGLAAAARGALILLLGAAIGGFVDHRSEGRPRGCHSIETAPFRIFESGRYCLRRDLTYSASDAIVVAADSVTIDLSGHKLSAGDQVLDRDVRGIRGVGHRDVLVRNGSITGFMYGISLVTEGVGNFTIQNTDLEGNTFRGIHLVGAGASVSGNHIEATGGTIVFHDSYAMGIEMTGPSCVISGNSIIDTLPVGVGEGVGVAIVDGDGCVISDNVILNAAAPPQGHRFGVWIGGNNQTEKVIVRNNTIVAPTYAFGSGIGSGLVLADNTVWAAACGVLYESPPQPTLRRTSIGMSPLQDCPDNLDHQMPLALKGDPAAAFRVGMTYYEGIAVKQDLSLAHAWLTVSSELGNLEAARWVSLLQKVFPNAGFSAASEIANDLRRQVGLQPHSK